MTPYVAYGNEELKNQPEAKKGMEIICPHCGQLHKLEYGTDAKTGEESDTLSFYSCPITGKDYLAGVNGKLIIGLKK